MQHEGASADLEHKMSWMTQPLSTIANYTVFMRFHVNWRTWLIKTRPIAFEIRRDNAIFPLRCSRPRVEAGKSFTVWQLCIFFATPQRLRKIKINCLLLNLLSKFHLHLNAFQRLHSKMLCSPCLTFATHCCHFNSAALLSSRKMQ